MGIIDPHIPLNDSHSTSETSLTINCFAFLISLGTTFLAYLLGVRAYVSLTLVLVLSLLVFCVGLEWIVYPRTSWRSLFRRRRGLSFYRVLCRELVLLLTLATIGFLYWLLPLFADSVIVKCYFPFLKIVIPLVLAVSLPYFCLMDCIDYEEEDVYCRLGRSILTHRKLVTRFEMTNFVRSWMVKAFWLAVMQPQMIEKLGIFFCYKWSKLAGNPVEIFLMATVICFAIDLAFAVSGYLLNIKLFNLHTRTAEPTLLGWISAIFCYWPFWGILFYPYFFKYESDSQWYALFSTGSTIWWLWGALIILCDLIYALATVSAGIRFSNLTYRGLWNVGPYRWTKHPAYVFKCISWWLIYLPFILNSGSAAIRCTLLLALVNVVYYFRARTEERHLSHYPEYVAYAREMNNKSIFRWVAQLLPFLKYRSPEELGAMSVFEVRRIRGDR